MRSTNCGGAVASNEDDAIELMMYRQSGGRSDVAPAEPLPDEPGPAERGEAPALREVTMRVFRSDDRQLMLSVEGEKLTFINRLSPFKLQVSVKFGENHRFCNIKVSKHNIRAIN